MHTSASTPMVYGLKQNPPPSPPAVVIQVIKYDTFYEILKEKQITFTTLVNKEDVQINVDNENSYRKLTALLNGLKAEWYTYESKQTRPIKIVAKNLHQSCREDFYFK